MLNQCCANIGLNKERGGGSRMFGESRRAFFCCCVMPYVGVFSKNACARVIIKFKVIFRVQGQINHLKDLIGLYVSAILRGKEFTV